MEEEKKNIPESEPDAASAAAPDQSAEGTPAASSSDGPAPASDGVGAAESAEAPAEESAPADEGEAPAASESDGVGAAESAGVPAEESAPADEGQAPAASESDGAAAAESAEAPAEESAPADEGEAPAASESDGVGAAESAGVPAEESAPADEGAEPPAVPAPAEATPAADASPAAETAVSAAPVPGSSAYDIEVKRPKRGRVRDREGFELGKLRRGVWYDTDKNRRGEFIKEDDKNVYLYEGENENRRRTGYVDKHNNIHTLQNEYVGTIVHARTPWLLILCILLALITALTCILCAWALTRSESPYAPIIFATEEDGTNWEDREDLSVFYNQTFGDKVIVPGMTGAYRFRMQNNSPDPIVYSLTFSETNEYGIAMRYRLKRDGVYIAGEEGYVTVEELCLEDLSVEEESITLFELEWIWAHNDPVDTFAGENEAMYYLHIDFLAEVWQERQ